MRIIDDIRDRTAGRFRIETGEPDPRTQRRMRVGGYAFIGGIMAAALGEVVGWSFGVQLAVTLLVMLAVTDIAMLKSKDG